MYLIKISKKIAKHGIDGKKTNRKFLVASACPSEILYMKTDGIYSLAYDEVIKINGVWKKEGLVEVEHKILKCYFVVITKFHHR